MNSCGIKLQLNTNGNSSQVCRYNALKPGAGSVGGVLEKRLGKTPTHTQLILLSKCWRSSQPKVHFIFPFCGTPVTLSMNACMSSHTLLSFTIYHITKLCRSTNWSSIIHKGVGLTRIQASPLKRHVWIKFSTAQPYHRVSMENKIQHGDRHYQLCYVSSGSGSG